MGSAQRQTSAWFLNMLGRGYISVPEKPSLLFLLPPRPRHARNPHHYAPYLDSRKMKAQVAGTGGDKEGPMCVYMERSGKAAP